MCECECVGVAWDEEIISIADKTVKTNVIIDKGTEWSAWERIRERSLIREENGR